MSPFEASPPQNRHYGDPPYLLWHVEAMTFAQGFFPTQPLNNTEYPDLDTALLAARARMLAGQGMPWVLSRAQAHEVRNLMLENRERRLAKERRAERGDWAVLFSAIAIVVLIAAGLIGAAVALNLMSAAVNSITAYILG